MSTLRTASFHLPLSQYIHALTCTYACYLSPDITRRCTYLYFIHVYANEHGKQCRLAHCLSITNLNDPACDRTAATYSVSNRGRLVTIRDRQSSVYNSDPADRCRFTSGFSLLSRSLSSVLPSAHIICYDPGHRRA